MKTLILAVASILTIFRFSYLLNLTREESEPAHGTASDCRFQCPPPPSFTELANRRNSDGSGSDNINGNWYSSALEMIRKEEYNITYSDELRAYQSPNRANNIRFIYYNDGFTAEERDAGERGNWRVKLKVESSKLNDVPGENKLQVAGNKAWTENEKIRIDYTNTEKGMRQDFIIKQRPAGEGKLRLDLAAETNLNTIIGADALIFSNNRGEELMKYSALKVWDAKGKILRAYFERKRDLRIKNYETGNGNDGISQKRKKRSEEVVNYFSVVVNDADAVYPITIDPLSTSPGWTAEGEQMSANFGTSVSTVGDVNGDGYSDVIIGAPEYDNGQTNEGRTFVYHGSSAGLSATANWTAEINQARASFGSAVSTAGDVNGDGYSDVIIGAVNFDNVQVNEGKIYVYHGSSAGLNTAADWMFESNQDNSLLGVSVSTACDVNGDGYSDIIAGLPNYNGGQSFEGRVVVFHGSASGLSTSPDWISESNQANTNFGRSVSSAGDVNGDGFSDVIIGASGYDNTETDEGAAYVFHGSASGLSSSSDWTAESNQAFANFGISVSNAGDVNGDGYSDVVVGAYAYDDLAIDAGAIFAYYGSASGLNASPNFSTSNNQESAAFGYSVSLAGDVNGDGFSDVIAGAYGYDNGQNSEGRAYVYYGSLTGLLPQQSGPFQWITESNQANAYFGYSVSTAGDVNGDGYSDVIVGAYGYDNGHSNEGSAFAYHGSPGGLRSSASHTAESNQSDANFGYSVSTAGDVNGDGYSDIVIGAESFDNGELNEGRVYVFHGSASGPGASADWIAESERENARFGCAVSTAGDVNGDGYSDIIVGANLYTGDQPDEGRAYVYHGSATGLSAFPDWIAEGNQANSFFGGSVSTAGDVNGDGFADVIVGAKLYDNGQNQEGRALVYFGSSSGLSTIANWSAEGNQNNSNFGGSVSTAGDVNGDGFSDVIIGATGYTDGQSSEGGAYVHYGSASGLSNTADWIAQGNQTNANFGCSVSSAGDVNGDGYSDAVIGSRLFDNGFTDEGRAFVFHGSSSGLSSAADWSAQSYQSSAGFGSSVSSAGDVNGDGYSDVIIGAPNFDGGQVDEGIVFVYHGSQTGLNPTQDWTKESDQIGANLGNAVSSAGDVNGDGYSDVIVGSSNYDNGEFNEGRSYVYYGNLAAGLRSTVQQYEPGSYDVVSSGGLTGSDGEVRMSIFGKSPFGRCNGRIVYDRVTSSVSFNSITSTSFAGSGSYTDLGTAGVQLTDDEAGLMSDKVYKWRARVQYDMVKNPYRRFGPWKYYNSYVPVPSGDFRASDGNLPAVLQLDLSLLIQGFYNSGSDIMVQDSAVIYLRNSSFPYSIVDSARTYLNVTGSGTFFFGNAVNGTPYYLQVRHRNSVETWSATAQSFVSNFMTFDLTTSASQAFGSNLIQVDASPFRFAIYGGDVNQDGTIDATDVSMIDNDAQNFLSGYVVTDLTGDDFVDGTDFAIADNNAANFVSAVRP